VTKVSSPEVTYTYTTYTYDKANRLEAITDSRGNKTLSYSRSPGGQLNRVADSEGKQTEFFYDALDHVSRVSGSDIATEYYKYDAEGRRIEKRLNTTVERFLYSGKSIWSEYGGDWSAALAHYSYTGLDAPIMRAAKNPTQTRYYHSDGLGSIVATSDANGMVDGLNRYDAWGNSTASVGSIPRYGYTGREPDATGFAFYRARYYDPQTGRFLQRDPSGFSDGVNLYAYVGNSPSNFVDPLGMTKQAVSIQDILTSSYPGEQYFASDGGLGGAIEKNEQALGWVQEGIPGDSGFITEETYLASIGMWIDTTGWKTGPPLPGPPSSLEPTAGYRDYNLTWTPVGSGAGAVIGLLATGGNPLGVLAGAVIGSISFTGGIMFNPDGSKYPHFGVSFDWMPMPNVSAAITSSNQTAVEGFNVGVSWFPAYVGGQVGYTFGTNGAPSGVFIEGGGGTPGGSLDLFYSFPWDSPLD